MDCGPTSLRMVMRNFIVTCFLFASLHAFSQSATPPIEKTYLHLDKQIYGAGDTIWFKAYVVAGSNHELSTISNVLNVELVNSRDSVKKNLKLSMINGMCHGGLALSDSIKEGNYRVRAYTTWMRNDDEEYFFDQNVRIINAIIDKPMVKTAQNINTKNAAPSQTVRKAGVQFFPEGGNMVNGLNCRIAFKATTAKGLGMDATGIVTDEQGNQVAEFSCGKLGMGFFYLEPDASKNYKATIKLADNTTLTVPLPKATTNGYVLSVTPSGPDHIRVAAQAIGIPAGEMTLTGRLGGIVYYEGKSKPGSNSFIANIPKNKFPTGVVQFTLLSSTGEPLSERLVFVQNNDQLKLDITSEKQVYAPQQRVKVQLDAKSIYDGKPAKGSFSVAVINEAKVPVGETPEGTILSNLLLTSDLKGYIEDPGYYFASADQQRADDLDALMLTQGYRKFTWQQDIKYPADTGLTISGHLKRGIKPVIKGHVTLYTIDGGFYTLDTLTDKDGRFAFKNLAFADSMNFIVQSDEKQRFNDRISLDLDKLKATPTKNVSDLSIGEINDSLSFAQNNKQRHEKELLYDYNGKAKLLREVTIKAVKRENLASSNSILKGRHADYTVTAKQLTALKIGNTSDALIGLIPGLLFNGSHQLLISASPNAPPLIIVVDGFVVPDLDMIRPSNIESVELILTPQSGVLIVTTKRGTTDEDVTYTEGLSGYQKFSPRGFYKVREFYSPQYDNPKTNKEIADLRTTIYWNPTLVTDKDSNTSFEYFNATKGTYRVTVEGIDSEGRLGSAVYSYKVE